MILTNANQFCLISTLNIVTQLQIFTIILILLYFLCCKHLYNCYCIESEWTCRLKVLKPPLGSDINERSNYP